MVSSSIRLTAWLQNSKKRAERSERLMCRQSPRLSPALDLSASSSACHGLLIITVITPLPTKPSATKNARELKLANGPITDMQMRQRDVASLRAERGVSWCKAEKLSALRDDVAAGRRQFALKAVCQSVREAPPPAWIMQPPPTGRHRWTGLFHPQKADHYAKTTGRNPEVY